jgi:hypothetical protein
MTRYLRRYSDGLPDEGQGSVPEKGQIFLFFIASKAHTQCILVAISPGIKRQVREADHTPPSSTEVKNGGAIPPLPPDVFMT